MHSGLFLYTKTKIQYIQFMSSSASPKIYLASGIYQHGLWASRIIEKSQPGKCHCVPTCEKNKTCCTIFGKESQKGSNTISSSFLASSKLSCLEIHNTLHLQVASDLSCPWAFTLYSLRIQNANLGWFRKPFSEVMVQYRRMIRDQHKMQFSSDWI